MKWRYLTILMMLLGGFTLLGSTQQRVEAATYWMDPVKLPDGSTTLYTNAPPELSPGVPGYIPFADSQTDPNNAMFTSLGNAIRITSSSNTTKPNVGLMVTPPKANQSGAIWTNQPIFNLSKQHQSISMNILIQATGSAQADGMAFALAGGAMPTTTGLIGGSIGVWAAVTPATQDINTYVKTALQNSAVITFDTHKNSPFDDSSGATSYVGFGYPAYTKTYTLKSAPASSQINFSKKITGGDDLTYMPADAATFVTDISQQQWHVFDVNWDRDSTGGTLTYRLSNATSNGKSPIVEKVHWTDADINKIFFNNVAPAQEKVRVGFTGTTGDLYEANVLAFRTIPGIVNANGTETLTKNGSPVNSVAAVTTNDQLQYNFNINYDNDSQESWTTAADGTLTLTFTKNKYFKLMNSQVALTHADGSPVTNADGSQAYAKLSLAKTSSQAGFADDPTKVIVSGIPGFIKGSSETGSQTLKFSINTIVDTISNSEIPSNSQSLYSDDTGVVAGDNAQVHLENPDNNSDPFTIQYSIKNTGAIYAPPPSLDAVPTLDFINLKRYLNNSNSFTAGQPKISELISGQYDTKPVFTTAADYYTTLHSKDTQLTATTDTSDRNNQGTPKTQGLTVTGNKTKWSLSLALSQFTATRDGKTVHLPENANVLLSNFKDQSTASLWPSSAAPAIIQDNNTATPLLSASNLPVSNTATNSTGGTDFSSGSGTNNLYGVLYFSHPMPTVQAGDYTSTATWTLTTAP